MLKIRSEFHVQTAHMSAANQTPPICKSHGEKSDWSINVSTATSKDAYLIKPLNSYRRINCLRSHEGKEFGVWLDHSGNFLRFRPDWDRIFDFGVEELDGGLTEKAKKEPTEKEKVEAKCPSCGALWIWKSDECGECGHVKKKVAQIQVVDGEMQELEFQNSQLNVNNRDFYAELRFYAMSRGYKDGWAAYKYKEKFGVFPNNLPKNVKPVSQQTMNWIKSRMIAYSKSKQRVAA